VVLLLYVRTVRIGHGGWGVGEFCTHTGSNEY
jgi:hypothetical protein